MFITISVLAVFGWMIVAVFLVGLFLFMYRQPPEKSWQYLLANNEVCIQRSEMQVADRITTARARERCDDTFHQLTVVQQYSNRIAAYLPGEVYVELVRRPRHHSSSLQKLAYRLHVTDSYENSFSSKAVQLMAELQTAEIGNVRADFLLVFTHLPALVDCHPERVLQSLVTQILRDARPTAAERLLAVDHATLCLLFRDNGMGLKTDWLQNFRENTWGWKSIYFRLQVLQGRVHLPSDAAGTCVQLSIPISKAA